MTAGNRSRAVAGIAALTIASVALFLVSFGKWSDAIIDSGREWIVPDALARGDLLYRDVVYWFGPFTPYFHAAFFALFGSSFRTLVAAGIVGSIGVLAALHFALRRVTGKSEAALWTALAVPALIFMPNAGGPILGMGYRIWHAAAFALAAITAASGPSRRPHALRPVMAGTLCALAGLCRTEWGLVALAAVWIALAVRSRFRRRLLRDAALASAGFVTVFGGTLAIFVLLAGWKTVIADNHLLLTGLPKETREFLVAFSGVRDWKAGLAEMIYSAAMWVGVFLLVDLLSRSKTADVRKRAFAFVTVLAVLGFSAVLGGAGGAVIFGGAPLVALGGLLAGALRGRGSRAAALASSGVAGLLLCYRRPFHIGDSAYVGPPLLFAFVCAAGLLHLALARTRNRTSRARLRMGLAMTTICLTVLSFAARAVTYRGDPRVPIPGTGGMLSALPDRVDDLGRLTADIRRMTKTGDHLVVFPEGEIVNQLSGRLNPLRNKLYIPGYLGPSNESEILDELERAKPAAIVVWDRPTGEYGLGSFGQDYGTRITTWIDQEYERCAFNRRSSPRARSRAAVWARKDRPCLRTW